MPSDQLVRQWTLLQELAVSRRGKSLPELGRLLEVSPRTARRDVEDLQAAGFPVEPLREGKSVRFRLERNYAPPQIPLELGEALALYHATLFSTLFSNPAYHTPLEAALVKLLHAFPPAVREYVGRFKVAWSHRSPAARSPQLLGVVRVLQEQASDGCRVRLVYRSLKGETTERLVDPYCLRVHQGEIYLLGYCHLRGAERVFLLDRVEQVLPQDEPFQVAPGFDPEHLLKTSLGIYLGKPYRASLRFHGEAASYVLERPIHPEQHLVARSDAEVVIEVPVRGEKEVLQTVLRFGASAEILGPSELRAAARAEVRKIAALYGEGEGEVLSPLEEFTGSRARPSLE
jgi:predicted DNA-binding transcriptional regulator YafY